MDVELGLAEYLHSIATQRWTAVHLQLTKNSPCTGWHLQAEQQLCWRMTFQVCQLCRSLNPSNFREECFPLAYFPGTDVVMTPDLSNLVMHLYEAGESKSSRREGKTDMWCGIAWLFMRACHAVLEPCHAEPKGQ